MSLLCSISFSSDCWQFLHKIIAMTTQSAGWLQIERRLSKGLCSLSSPREKLRDPYILKTSLAASTGGKRSKLAQSETLLIDAHNITSSSNRIGIRCLQIRHLKMSDIEEDIKVKLSRYRYEGAKGTGVIAPTHS
jgi:hypothetical protein